MKSVKKFRQKALIFILSFTLMTGGCNTLLNGDFQVELLSPDEIENGKKNGVDSRIVYDPDYVKDYLDDNGDEYNGVSTVGSYKYESEYNDAFYIPDNLAKEREFLHSFQVLDYVDNKYFVYLYQTFAYNGIEETAVKNTNENAEYVFEHQGDEKTVKKTISTDKLYTVLAVNDFTKKDGAGYVEIARYVTGFSDNVANHAVGTVQIDENGNNYEVKYYAYYFNNELVVINKSRMIKKADFIISGQQRKADKLQNIIEYDVNLTDELAAKINAYKDEDPNKASEAYAYDIQDMSVYWNENNDSIKTELEFYIYPEKLNEQNSDADEDEDGYDDYSMIVSVNMQKVPDLYLYRNVMEVDASSGNSLYSVYYGSACQFASDTTLPFGYTGSEYTVFTPQGYEIDALFNRDVHFVFFVDSNSRSISEIENVMNGSTTYTYDQNVKLPVVEKNSRDQYYETYSRFPNAYGTVISTPQVTFCNCDSYYYYKLENPLFIEITNCQISHDGSQKLHYVASDSMLRYRQGNDNKYYDSMIYYDTEYVRMCSNYLLYLSVYWRLLGYYDKASYTYSDYLAARERIQKSNYYLSVLGNDNSVLATEELSIKSGENLTAIDKRCVNGKCYVYFILNDRVLILDYSAFRAQGNNAKLKDYIMEVELYKFRHKREYNNDEFDAKWKENIYYTVREDFYTSEDKKSGFYLEFSHQGISMCDFAPEIIEKSVDSGNDVANNYDGQIEAVKVIDDLKFTYDNCIRILDDERNGLTEHTAANTFSNPVIIERWDSVKETVRKNLYWKYQTKLEDDMNVTISNMQGANLLSFKYNPGTVINVDHTGIEDQVWESILRMIEQNLTQEEEQSEEELTGQKTPPESYNANKLTVMNFPINTVDDGQCIVSSTPLNGIICQNLSDNNIFEPMFQKNEVYEKTVGKLKEYYFQYTYLKDGVSAYGIFENNDPDYPYFYLGFDKQSAIYVDKDIAQAKVIPFKVADNGTAAKYGLKSYLGQNLCYIQKDCIDRSKYKNAKQEEGYPGEDDDPDGPPGEKPENPDPYPNPKPKKNDDDDDDDDNKKEKKNDDDDDPNKKKQQDDDDPNKKKKDDDEDPENKKKKDEGGEKPGKKDGDDEKPVVPGKKDDGGDDDPNNKKTDDDDPDNKKKKDDGEEKPGNKGDDDDDDRPDDKKDDGNDKPDDNNDPNGKKNGDDDNPEGNKNNDNPNNPGNKNIKDNGKNKKNGLDSDENDKDDKDGKNTKNDDDKNKKNGLEDSGRIRVYQDDFDGDRNPFEQMKEDESRNRKKLVFIIIGAVLLAALISGGIVYWRKKRKKK